MLQNAEVKCWSCWPQQPPILEKMWLSYALFIADAQNECKHTRPKSTHPLRKILCKVSNNLNIYWTSLSRMATCFKNNRQYYFSWKVRLFYCNHSAPFRKSRRILNCWMKLYLVEQWPEHFKAISFSLTIPRGRPTLQLAIAFMKTTYPSKRGKKTNSLLALQTANAKPKKKGSNLLQFVPGIGGRARNKHYSNTKCLAIFPVKLEAILKACFCVRTHGYLGPFNTGKLRWTPEIFFFWKGSPGLCYK